MKTLLEEHDVVEGMIRGIVEQGVSPVKLLIGIHNAFSHGGPLVDIGLEIPAASLEKLFKGFDIAIEAMKEIEEASGLR